MHKKKLINFIVGYHPQVFWCFEEENVFLMVSDVALDQGRESEIVVYQPLCDITKTPGFNTKHGVVYLHTIGQFLSYLRKNRHHTVYSNTLTISSLLIGFFAKKSIFIPHDPPIPLSWIKKVIVLFFYRFFTLIRVMNQAEKKLLQSYGLRNAHIIPLVISSRFYQPERKHNGNLLLLGNITAKKDPITVLKALQIVIQYYPSITIHQIGSVQGYCCDGLTYSQLVAQYGLDNNLISYGVKTHQEVVDMNLDSCIYANSSHAEGQCLSVYDAILLGHAVCLPNILAFDGVLGDHALYHDSYDYKMLALNIIYYLSHEDMRNDHIKMNQKYVLETYSSDYIRQKLLTYAFV